MTYRKNNGAVFRELYNADNWYKKDGLIKILLSMAAVDVVIRNIRNGRYMNFERSACK